MNTGLIFAVVGAAFYLLGRPVRRFLTWGQGQPELAPKERIAFMLPVIVTIMFIAGWYSEPTVDRALVCA